MFWSELFLQNGRPHFKTAKVVNNSFFSFSSSLLPLSCPRLPLGLQGYLPLFSLSSRTLGSSLDSQGRRTVSLGRKELVLLVLGNLCALQVFELIFLS